MREFDRAGKITLIGVLNSEISVFSWVGNGDE